MSEFIWLYIYTTTQSAESLLWGIYLIGGFCVGMYFVFSAMNADLSYRDGKEGHNALKANLTALIKRKLFLLPLMLLFTLSVLVPSKDDIKVIIAGGLVWKAGQSVSEIDGISELPENIVNAMNAFLEGVESDGSNSN